MRMNVICASHPRLQGHKHNPRSSLTIIHLGGPVWLTTAEEVSKFLLQCILQQNMNLLANQFLMPAFRALCCVCKKLINEHCSIIPVPSCSLGLIYSVKVKDCFQAAAGWGIYLWPANLQLFCSPPIFTFLYFLNTKTRLNIRTQYSLWQELRRYSALQYPIYQKCRYNFGLELQLAGYLDTTRPKPRWQVLQWIEWTWQPRIQLEMVLQIWIHITLTLQIVCSFNLHSSFTIWCFAAVHWCSRQFSR